MKLKSIGLLSALLLPSVGMAQHNSPVYLADGAVAPEQSRSYVTLESFKNDENVLIATNGVKLYLSEMNLYKTFPGTNIKNSHETGVNSTALVEKASNVRMEDCGIFVNSENSDGLIAMDEGTRVEMIKCRMSSSRKNSALLNAQSGAEIEVRNLDVLLNSKLSPVFYANNKGRLTIQESYISINGDCSPLFQSVNDGEIDVSRCNLGTEKWAVANVEGGKLSITACDLKASDLCGFLLRGREERTVGGVLELERNHVKVKEGPVFLVTNTDATITLNHNSLEYSRDDYFMKVMASDWGKKGTNGGNVTLNVGRQNIRNNIMVDSISSLTLNMQNGSSFTGQINEKEMQGAVVNVIMHKGSSWSSKGVSNVTTIQFEEPFEKGLKRLKGKFVIYYDAADPVNAYLEGKEYISGKGRLCPK